MAVRVLAGGPLVVASLYILEQFFGFNLGVTASIIRNSRSSISADVWNMSSGGTVLCIFLLAASVLALSSRRRHSPIISQAFALLGGFIAWFALFGHLFGVSRHYWRSVHLALSFQSVLFVLLLSVAICCVRFDQGPVRLITSDTFGGDMARKLMLGLTIGNMFLATIVIFANRAGVLPSDVGVVFLATSNLFVSFFWINRVGDHLNLAEAGRRDSERMLKEIISSAPAIVYMRDLEGKLMLANPEYAKIRECAGARCPEEGDALGESEMQVVRSGSMLQMEKSCKVGDAKRTYLANRFPVYGEGDRMIGVCTVGIDITDRLKFEEKLRQSEEAFRTLADAIPNIVWTTDRAGHITYFNRRWFEFTGLSPSHDYDSDLVRVVHPDDRDMTFNAWKTSFTKGEPFKIEHRMRRYDGIYRWHLVRGLPLRESSGRIARWFGSSVDIEDQKREAETLERRVAERTRDLTAANRELEAFSYSVSHDLRAPLRSMDGFSQILLDRYGQDLDETGRSYLKRVRNASQNMATLIDDLLVLSRIGRTEVVKDPVDVSAMVEELIHEKRRADPRREVEVRIQSGAHDVADASLLGIALSNLIDNAWKYTSRTASPVIEFRFERHSKESFDGSSEECNIYTICDNGAGFDMAHAGQLFRPFQRLHSVKDFPGTGIGLATAHRIIERHGGAIWAEGEPGAGASFHFTLGHFTLNHFTSGHSTSGDQEKVT